MYLLQVLLTLQVGQLLFFREVVNQYQVVKTQMIEIACKVAADETGSTCNGYNIVSIHSEICLGEIIRQR
jgi:hypothetical protein